LQLLRFNNPTSKDQKKNMTTLHWRKSISRSSLRFGFLLILLVLVCFAPSPRVQAVLPAPGGSYGPPPYGAGNTAEGQNALLGLTTGVYNTAVGWFSLQSVTGGNFNTRCWRWNAGPQHGWFQYRS
jgi:hypothetical protein